MNHQLKIFRDVIFGPVFSASVVAQIVQPNLIYGKERQPDVLQPSLSFSERANTTALLDSLASQEDGMPHQRRVTSKDAAKQEVPLVQSIGVNRKHVDKIRLATLVIQCLGSVLRESKELIVEKFWDRLENNGLRHSRVSIIDEDEMADGNVVAEHGVSRTV